MRFLFVQNYNHKWFTTCKCRMHILVSEDLRKLFKSFSVLLLGTFPEPQVFVLSIVVHHRLSPQLPELLPLATTPLPLLLTSFGSPYPSWLAPEAAGLTKWCWEEKNVCWALPLAWLFLAAYSCCSSGNNEGLAMTTAGRWMNTWILVIVDADAVWLQLSST